MSDLSRILGAPALGSDTGELVPLGWGHSETNRRAVGSLDPCEEHAYARFLLKQGGLQLRQSPAGLRQPSGHVPLRCSPTVRPHTGVRVVVAEGRIGCEAQRWLRPVVAAAAAVDAYAGRASVAVWGPDFGQTDTAAGPCPARPATKLRATERTAAAEEEFDCEEQRQFIPQRHLSGAETAITGFYKGSSSEALWLRTVAGVDTARAQTRSEGLHQPPVFPAPHSGVRVPFLGGVFTVEGDGASSDMTLGASDPAAWDPPPQ